MRRALALVVAALATGCYDFDSLPGLYRAVDGGADLARGGDAMTACGAGGATWTVLPTPTATTLVSVWAATASDVWAVGGTDVLLHFDGSAWRALAYPTISSAVATPFPERIAGSGPDDVYLVTHGGAVLHTVDHGAHWSETDVATPDLFSVWLDAPTNVWIVGTGVVARSTGSGAFAKVGPSGITSPTMVDVWGAGAHVFAVGALATIYETVDGGVHWGSANLPQAAAGAYDYGAAVWGATTSDVFLVGDEGSIWHDAGATWPTPIQPRPLPSTSSGLQGLHAVWGTGPNDVYAAGDAGTLLHSGDDGAHWAQESTGQCSDASGPSLRAIHGAGGAVFVVGAGGLVLRKP